MDRRHLATVTVTWDGRVINTKEKLLAWLKEIDAERAAGLTFEELEARAREHQERYGPVWTHLDWDWNPVTDPESDLAGDARVLDYAGLRIRVASLNTIVASKEFANRPTRGRSSLRRGVLTHRDLRRGAHGCRGRCDLRRCLPPCEPRAHQAAQRLAQPSLVASTEVV